MIGHVCRSCIEDRLKTAEARTQRLETVLRNAGTALGQMSHPALPKTAPPECHKALAGSMLLTAEKRRETITEIWKALEET